MVNAIFHDENVPTIEHRALHFFSSTSKVANVTSTTISTQLEKTYHLRSSSNFHSANVTFGNENVPIIENRTPPLFSLEKENWRK
jgi:hypothetical protein